MKNSEFIRYRWRTCRAVAAVFLFALALSGSVLASDGFRITEAKWESGDNRLVVKGKKDRYRDVTVTNADTGALVGTYTRSKEEWTLEKIYSSTSSVPCRVLATQEDGQTDERNVRDVPSDCDDGGGGPGPGPGPGFPNQTDFKIMMNYELGMHCTGFEFAYCCVLPVYNSILAQVVKPQGNGNNDGFAELLEGDPNAGLDGLNRQTYLRDPELDSNDNFKKYVLKYWHDAQPRNDGRGKVQNSTLISAVEGNSMLAWNTTVDSAALNPDGSLKTGTYNGSTGVVVGDGDLNDPTDNYQNAVWNHLYFYEDLEGSNSTGTSLEADKIRLGVQGMVEYLDNCGPALHPMGPTGNGVDGGDCGTGVSNDLTFSGEHGTIVFTQMKLLENLPVTLTSPRIWEALGLPLTPFEDTIDFFGDPGLVDEDSIRPYVEMKAQLHDAVTGNAVLDSSGNPVIGFGTAPIDIPNCERCHSNGPGTANTPNYDAAQWALVQEEYNFWNAYYGIGAGDSDWYSRLKSAAISMMVGHDTQHGTSFAANYPGCGSLGDPNDTTGCGPLPQNTRLGHESVICQKCHADNVIAVVKSANGPGGQLIPPVTEAVHYNHRSVSEGGPIEFSDGLGRDGGCQGCHPAHRSDGDMSGYPITLGGENFYKNSDNRVANGGCFVGRDVHSNPMKDVDGAETPSHMNAVGQWLVDNVVADQGEWRGIWCTNCHTQLSQELWKTENCPDLINGDCITNPRGEPTLAAVASAIGVSEQQAVNWLDPGTHRPTNETHSIWAPDPGLCNFLVNPTDPAQDGTVVTLEVAIPAMGHTCSTPDQIGPVDCSGVGGPIFNICVTNDADGDPSVNALDFCTTPDCVAAAQATLANSAAVAVPFSAATDGRDHWLSPGEPHCADCHAAPYVEQSGNINAFTPFNYPRKASLMRYSRGHRDITCQGCHESIHGLYPVTPTIDTTSYAQAASLNEDGSHGPLKCATCHDVGSDGLPKRIDDLEYNGQRIKSISDTDARFDAAVSWAHTFTEEADLKDGYCLNCHGDDWNKVSYDEEEWLEHAMKGRASRKTMDQTEIEKQGFVSGDPAFQDPRNTVCRGCHGDEWSEVSCSGSDGREWKEHLIEGRVAESVWEYVSEQRTGTTCGW